MLDAIGESLIKSEFPRNAYKKQVTDSPVLGKPRAQNKHERKILLMAQFYTPEQVKDNLARLQLERESLRDTHETSSKARIAVLSKGLKLCKEICLWQDVGYAQMSLPPRPQWTKQHSLGFARKTQARMVAAAARYRAEHRHQSAERTSEMIAMFIRNEVESYRMNVDLIARFYNEPTEISKFMQAHRGLSKLLFQVVGIKHIDDLLKQDVVNSRLRIVK